MKNAYSWLLFLFSFTAGAQMNWSEGEYALFSTVRSGIHKIYGTTLIHQGVLSEGDQLDRLVILHRPEGELPHINGLSNGGLQPIDYKVVDSDGMLDANSLVLFYLNAPFDMEFKDSTYSYSEHSYSEREHFVISALPTSSNQQMVEQDRALVSNARNINLVTQFHVVDSVYTNLVGTGRRWFGDLFDFTTQRSYNLPLSAAPNTVLDIKVNAVARANSSTTKLEILGGGSVNFPSVGTSSVADYVTERALHSDVPAGSGLNAVVLNYDKAGNSNAAMWLDKLVVNYWTNLEYQPSATYQKRYQNFPRGAGNFSTFEVSTATPQSMHVFELRPDGEVRDVQPNLGTSNVSWSAPEDTLLQYLIVSTNDAFVPRFERQGILPNLADYGQVKNLIIAPDSLLPQAERLAGIHVSTGLASKAISLESIYAIQNAGTPDIAAIREFLYDLRQGNPELAYLTLLGDASYDYKGKLPERSNLVPTFEAYGSFSLYTSYITDDYYGYLDPGEGVNWFSSDLDIGIGRLPVTNSSEAAAAIDKIQRYYQSPERFGPWRSNAVLVADDVDHAWEKEFAVVQDRLAKYIDTARTEMEVVKIYSDAFTQESKPGSQRYPTAREKLFREVGDGALVVSFVGHGGEVGWTTERILQLEDINAWSNNPKLPVFTTITCEFTRFDDPKRISAGEQLYLNPDGGAIALFSTTRSVFATNSTYDLNRLLNTHMMSLESPRLGDVLRTTKNNNISGDKIKFSLIGDPALPLARPEHVISFDTINGVEWSAFSDTLKALNWVSIEGHVQDKNGPLLADFNGEIWLTVFDKAQPQTTRVNDGAGGVFNFSTQNNAIFKGKATVKNGLFTFEFRVPLDINLSVGAPKVLAYATDYMIDAWGGDKSLNIGGVFDGIITDNEGPKVRLFVNDTNFVSGGTTNENPLGLALLNDESGINAVGLGIGHNITMTLDGADINVNDFYESDLNDFTSGTVKYPFFNLAPGPHQLELRAWDVLNQWGYDSISFVVLDAQEPILEQILAYPNPFTEEVQFSLQHNQQGQQGTLRLDLLANTGTTVYTWEEQLTLGYNETALPTFKVSELPAGTLSPGFYYARVQWISESNGKSSSIQEKLIFIR